MSLKPTVALHGALPILQPEYYYSDVFLTPMRLEIDALLTDFAQCLFNPPDQDGQSGSSSATHQTGLSPEQNSYEIFKTCWASNNWRFMHLRCLDAIGRIAFLRVLHRLFLEAAIIYQESSMKIGALYGLYTFHMTQPTQLCKLEQIPVPLDHLQQLFQLPLNLGRPHKLAATYLITTLISNKAFRVHPVSDSRPLNPAMLPQTFVAISTVDQDTRPRGPGRVTLTQRLRTAKRAVDELHTLLDGDGSHTRSKDIAPPSYFADYTYLRDFMITAAGPETVEKAIRETSRTVQDAKALLVQEGVTVEVDPELHAGQLLGLVRGISE